MSDILVAYFSAGGTTRAVAEKLADVIHADLFAIEPEQPYTRKDLNWMNPKSRSSLEMKSKTSRPPLAKRLENPKQYTHIFLGFPIWWYREPSIIDTFMESADFSGITVIPFCTSGGSELGESVMNLQMLADHAMVVPGKRFRRSVREQELKDWVKSLI